jgi:hypothetical protein
MAAGKRSPLSPGQQAGLILGTLFLSLGGGFLWIFNERYWRWRDGFNDLGRYWDPVSEQVFVEGAGWIWGTPAVLCLGIGGILFSWALRWSRRPAPGGRKDLPAGGD